MQVFGTKIRTKIKIFREKPGGFTAARGMLNLNYDDYVVLFAELIRLDGIGHLEIDVVM